MNMRVKVNKYLLSTFISLLLLGGLTGIIAYKYFPFLFHTTIYYCQALIQSFNLHILPKNSNLLVLGAVFAVFGIVLIRLIITIIQVLKIGYQLRRDQVKGEIYLSSGSLHKLGLAGNVAVIKSDDPFALCFGFFKPKIYVSTKLLEITSITEQQTILLHEKHHLEKKDNLTMLFAQVVQNIFPFIPSIQDLVLNFRIDRELAADHAAIADHQKNHMVSALKKLLLFERTAQLAFVPSISSADTLEARIQFLVKNKTYVPHYKWKRAIISSFSIGILLLLALTPVQAIEVHDNGNDAVMACVSSNECAQWCEKNSSLIQNMTPITNSSVRYSSVNASH